LRLLALPFKEHFTKVNRGNKNITALNAGFEIERSVGLDSSLVQIQMKAYPAAPAGRPDGIT
jgi:hypothetical protein